MVSRPPFMPRTGEQIIRTNRVAFQCVDGDCGRVEKRRGGGRRGWQLLPAAFAKCRCLNPSHCSVSSSRSSNAACGFPALRSPTGFTWGPRRAHVVRASVRDGLGPALRRRHRRRCVSRTDGPHAGPAVRRALFSGWQLSPQLRACAAQTATVSEGQLENCRTPANDVNGSARVVCQLKCGNVVMGGTDQN